MVSGQEVTAEWKMHPCRNGRSRVEVGQNLRYVNAVLLAVLALNGLHLVL